MALCVFSSILGSRTGAPALLGANLASSAPTCPCACSRRSSAPALAPPRSWVP
eukprot:CAMPEP_0113839786 /NCGR_PEP_ID=MMETSP0328-20130328/11268_1 /TAXON_ID=39455 /ORGANISM="Alexandrium minutum" /LENGTH=52 /DNA_ID=CAMNT_0000808429 /DNA_START=8 /DNA_END=163 /DNA_ORIENTATION=+ /assembly_acc=CAM_ASM_000350